MKLDKSKTTGIVGTAIVHAIVLLLLLVLCFRVPARQEESGMEVMLGNTDNAQGANEAYNYTPVETLQPEVTPQKPATENVAPPVKKEPIITQKDEPSAPIETAEEIEARKKAEAEKKAAQTASSQIASAFGKSSNMSAAKGNEGDNTTGTQGSPEGNPNSPSTKGNGIVGSYDLGGRSIVGSLPVPTESIQEEGNVVVNITVDPAGNVVATSINLQYTNTSNERMRSIAEKAAKRARFQPTNQTENQKGTITYSFKLR
ncbi:MAG: TonB family protein [Bacteroidaceae bacterium]|nr:TonB family protein [Bacteroidaceae bacterium]